MGSLLIAILNVLVTVVSLLLIDKFGRKMLMLAGLAVMLVSTVLLYVSLITAGAVDEMAYVAVAALCLFAMGYAVGPGELDPVMSPSFAVF